jgi:hypothetical protein
VNGKQKGSSFEREICKKLSLWTTNQKSVDVYWRSAMSGGRATVAKGKVRQAGDITAVAPEGHVLTDQFYLELKHLKSINLDCLIKGSGTLLAIWKKTKQESHKYQKIPVLIFKQNHWPVVLCTSYVGCDKLKSHALICVESVDFDMRFIRFDELLKFPFPL